MTGLLFLSAGRTKEGFIREGMEKYAPLIRRYVPLEVREVKARGGGGPGVLVDAEGDSLLSRLSAGDFVAALDEHGELHDSVSFAGLLGGLLESGRRVVFVTGGPFGLSDKVLGRADATLSLSRLTFTHEMARLILMEQVFRALTIIRGRAYHY